MEAIVGLVNNITLLAGFCFILGFIFLVIEMFHPGVGFPGICGGILLVVAVALTAKDVMQVLILVSILIAVLGITLTIALKSATNGRLRKRLVLDNSQNKELGYIGMDDLKYFLGREGTAVTILRPSGIADFDGVKVDVVSEGEYISKDTKVEVINVQGRKIVVRSIVRTKKS